MNASVEADAKTDSSSPGTQPSAGDMANPGARLGHARRERKLEIPRIAAELRLRPATVEALERDDFELLPSAVFVAGYIRSYARLVGLDPEPLLSRFRELHPGATTPPAPPPHRPSTARSRRTPVLLILSLLVLGGAMAYLWWISNRPETPSTTSAPSPDSDSDARQVGNAVGQETSETSIGGSGTTDAVREEGLAPTPPSDEPLGDPSVAGGIGRESAGAAAAVSEQSSQTGDAAEASRSGGEQPVTGNDRQTGDSLPVLPPATDAPVISSTPDGETATMIEPAPDAATPAAGDASDGQVVIAFTGPCWVDIRDADGKVQLFGEMGDGDRHALGGEPPYSLVIGNASATELTVAGQPFDVRAVSKGNVARFRLDPAEITAERTAQPSVQPSRPDAEAPHAARDQPFADGD